MLLAGADSALGASLARWLAGHGADRLVLVGADTPEREKLIAELSETGAEVIAGPGDATAAAALAALPAGTRLNAVIHVGAVTAARADGIAGELAALDEATAAHHPESFVVFSPFAGAAGLSGGPGAEAAAYIHAWAQRRHAGGRPTLAVGWGDPAPSAEDGGWRPPSHRLAEAVLGHVRSGGGSVLVADVDEARLTALLRSGPPVAAGAAVDELRSRLAAASPQQREALLLDLVCSQAPLALGYESGEPMDETASFLDLGFTSFAVLELCTALRERGIDLAPAAVFEHPTPRALARHLAAALPA
ncbi:beta-ketoacyl reductase [Dactylosporangium sp. CA-233914]|uniref:beta-ketoacyl reductase n=1 Tax=Dactylosporangium sp. CA-233914 TaxID=3239934 RepID=UPI003D8E2788